MKMRFFLALCLLLFAAPLIAESKSAIAEPVDEVDPEWAKEKISEGAMLVDLRFYGNYVRSSLGGAINIPVDQLEKKIALLGTDKKRHIVFYGEDGTSVKNAIKLLRKKGFENLYNAGTFEDLAGNQAEFEQQVSR